MFGTFLLVATLVGSAVLTVWQGWPTRSRIQGQLLPKYDYIIGMKYIVHGSKNKNRYSRTCLGRPVVWTTTRLGRPKSPARIVSNNKLPGVSDHLPDATTDRVVWFNQR